MIVRINFKGTVGLEKEQSIVNDSVDIHAPNIDMAKEIFLCWTRISHGIRGNSGTFHPLKTEGSVKMTKVVEQHA